MGYDAVSDIIASTMGTVLPAGRWLLGNWIIPAQRQWAQVDIADTVILAVWPEGECWRVIWAQRQ